MCLASEKTKSIIYSIQAQPTKSMFICFALYFASKIIMIALYNEVLFINAFTKMNQQ